MKKLFRSTTNRTISGLCGGIGELFNIDATIIRILFVVLAVCSLGTMILIYAVSSLIVPNSPYGDVYNTDHYRY